MTIKSVTVVRLEIPDADKTNRINLHEDVTGHHLLIHDDLYTVLYEIETNQTWLLSKLISIMPFSPPPARYESEVLGPVAHRDVLSSLRSFLVPRETLQA